MSGLGENTKVTVGGQEYTVQRFRGLKAILVAASMTRIARDVPDLLADATKTYYKRNTISITEAMSKLPRWEGFSKEDFDAAEKRTGLREIELPAPISPREQVLSALPALLEGARTELIRLFAILIIPNEELKQADKSDTLYEVLDGYEDLFLYEAELDEMVELMMAAQASIGQLNPKTKDRMGKTVRNLFQTLYQAITGEVPPPSMLESLPQTQETESIQQTSTDDVPTSSTDSPPRTDGIETPRSMVSPGVS